MIESSKYLTASSTVCSCYFWLSTVTLFKFLSVRAYGEATRNQLPLPYVELSWWTGVKEWWRRPKIKSRRSVHGNGHACAYTCQVQYAPETLLSNSLQTFSHMVSRATPATFFSSDMTVFPPPSSIFYTSFDSTWLWRQVTIIVISGHSSINVLYWVFYAENTLCMSFASCVILHL